MNYVPGTASLIDDIDSKSCRRSRSGRWRRFGGENVQRCGIVSDTNWIICNRFNVVINHACVGLFCREAPGAAPRWQDTDRLPQKH